MNKDYIVTKSNKLITSNYDLSLQEQKIILTLASVVQPGDTEFKEYKFKIKDFMELLEVKDKSKYVEIPKITKELMKKVFEIKEGTDLIQLSWLCSARYQTGEGIVTLKFAPDLKPYMLELKELYTSYKLGNVLSLKSKYSIRLYEILKSNLFKKFINIQLEELKKMVGANANYLKVYADFKNKVILQAQRELKEKTDISFDFEEIKTGRKVTSIKFLISSNNQDKQTKTESAAAADPADDKLNQLKRQIDQSTGGNISVKVLEKLIKKYGTERIKEKIELFPDLIAGKNIQNMVGFFVQSLIEDYKVVPNDMSSNKNQNGMIKQLDAYKFSQRNYTEEELEKLVGVNDIENEILEEKSEKQTTKI